MLNYIIIIFVTLIGFLIQKMSNGILSYITIFISNAMIVIIQNTPSLILVRDFTGLPEWVIIWSSVLFMASTMLSVLFLKLLKIKTMELRIEYADLFISKDVVQPVLDAIEQRVAQYGNLLGNSFYVSLYHITGWHFKRLKRVSYSSKAVVIPGSWNEVILSRKCPSFSISAKDNKIKITRYKNKREIGLDCFPPATRQWIWSNLTFQLSFPITLKLPSQWRREREEVKFILAVNSINNKMNDGIEAEQIVEMYNKEIDEIGTIVEECSQVFRSYNDYYGCI